jgi:hypothetical protein
MPGKTGANEPDRSVTLDPTGSAPALVAAQPARVSTEPFSKLLRLTILHLSDFLCLVWNAIALVKG